MFQSRSLRSSPGTYLRCSLNSTEKPWKGLACRPARKPSTMNLARKSSRETWRMTSGRRYFSAAGMVENAFNSPQRHKDHKVQKLHPLLSSLCSLCLCGESFPSLLIFGRFRFADGGQQLLDDVLAGFAFG